MEEKHHHPDKKHKKKGLKKRFRIVVLAVVLWDTAWKGIALWRAARKGQLPWFVAILFSNSAGAVPMAYLRKEGVLGSSSETGEKPTIPVDPNQFKKYWHKYKHTK
jgi:hypothetical protein